MRFFIELSYNGKAYHGWQNQPDAISVQEVVEKALSTLLKHDISIMGAGRTDAGVHASQLFAHFDTEQKFPDNFVFKLNSFLPKDIAVTTIFEVSADAHARFDALSRTYHYRVSTKKNVFNFDFSYALHKSLDVELMNKACDILLQYSDFQCFSKVNTDVKTYHCKLMQAHWTIENNELLFTIKADRFLRNMVRAIVGTLINIGLGKLELERLHDIIKSKDRSEAGFSVPAHGLYLVNVDYPKHIKLEGN
ncbi:tRNA pseudouridine(38-40) synthase TruA [Psychroserpens luteolus]|uniref:tRNA pseudouridine(38-40) synthase TruA n=1 Tax=Psychroserpens luteolus TaxID=2855840 RepID=UPI001E2BAEFC|nr:tRNA pseudouridine(38-40) synthase TruA [Psychroserpens luteolus]MCD2260367.1 tRNA pseudouridine(38-40) synthase TruA [Psychroserpens luteolus]